MTVNYLLTTCNISNDKKLNSNFFYRDKKKKQNKVKLKIENKGKIELMKKNKDFFEEIIMAFHIKPEPNKCQDLSEYYYGLLHCKSCMRIR